MNEFELHNLIINNINIRNNILKLLDIDINNKIEFIHEDKYPNGMYADFTIKYNNKVLAILECKSSDIGVNEYIRGIGQVYEYQHFIDSNLSTKDYEYSNTACAVYILPSNILKTNLIILDYLSIQKNVK